LTNSKCQILCLHQLNATQGHKYDNNIMKIVVDPNKTIKLKNGTEAKVTSETHNGYAGKTAAGINGWWHAQVWDKKGHCIGNVTEDYDIASP